MKILFNSEEINIPENSTVSMLKEFKNVPETGVAVAVNGKIVVGKDHNKFILNENDDVILISAAYGG